MSVRPERRSHPEHSNLSPWTPQVSYLGLSSKELPVVSNLSANAAFLLVFELVVRLKESRQWAKSTWSWCRGKAHTWASTTPWESLAHYYRPKHQGISTFGGRITQLASIGWGWPSLACQSASREGQRHMIHIGLFLSVIEGRFLRDTSPETNSF